jgi:hypothetical protein
MAHFAKINSDNVVEVVNVFSNDDINSNGGDYSAEAETWINSKWGGTWKQCSYNKSQRGKFPGKGWNWSPTKEKFYDPRPTDYVGNSCASWTLNTDTLIWESPTAYPGNSARAYTEDGIEKMKVVRWDESVKKWRACKDGPYGDCVTEWYWNPSSSAWEEIT